jgi:hypothetical protein
LVPHFKYGCTFSAYVLALIAKYAKKAAPRVAEQTLGALNAVACDYVKRNAARNVPAHNLC